MLTKKCLAVLLLVTVTNFFQSFAAPTWENLSQEDTTSIIQSKTPSVENDHSQLSNFRSEMSDLEENLSGAEHSGASFTGVQLPNIAGKFDDDDDDEELSEYNEFSNDKADYAYNQLPVADGEYQDQALPENIMTAEKRAVQNNNMDEESFRYKEFSNDGAEHSNIQFPMAEENYQDDEYSPINENIMTADERIVQSDDDDDDEYDDDEELSEYNEFSNDKADYAYIQLPVVDGEYRDQALPENIMTAEKRAVQNNNMDEESFRYKEFSNDGAEHSNIQFPIAEEDYQDDEYSPINENIMTADDRIVQSDDDDEELSEYNEFSNDGAEHSSIQFPMAEEDYQGNENSPINENIMTADERIVQSNDNGNVDDDDDDDVNDNDEEFPA